MADDDKMIDVTLEGGAGADGTLTGSGEIMIRFIDPAKAGMKIDYSSPDSLKLIFKGEVEIALTKDAKLNFEGDVKYDVLKKELGADAKLTFEINKNVSTYIEYEWGQKDGHKGLVGVKLSF